MSQYRKDFREAQSEYFWSLPRILLMLAIGIPLLSGLGYAINIASQPGRIVAKTLDAGNIIHNYEWFHDVNANYLARRSQVDQFKALYSAETEPAERNRLRMEMAAMQSSCRELARNYNANATKVNRGLFRGDTLPETLNAGACE